MLDLDIQGLVTTGFPQSCDCQVETVQVRGSATTSGCHHQTPRGLFEVPSNEDLGMKSGHLEYMGRRLQALECSQTTPCKPCEASHLTCCRKEQAVRAIDPVPFCFKSVDIFATGTLLSKGITALANLFRSPMQPRHIPRCSTYTGLFRIDQDLPQFRRNGGLEGGGHLK